MSVVVWDGISLAADRQCTNGEFRFNTQKLFRHQNGTLSAFTGSIDTGLAMRRWYDEGAQRETWPVGQRHENWSRLIIATDIAVFYYEQEPEAIPLLQKQMAWGSGRDFALGALAMGATAQQAVEIANQYCISCGFGVDVLMPTS